MRKIFTKFKNRLRVRDLMIGDLKSTVLKYLASSMAEFEVFLSRIRELMKRYFRKSAN